MASRQTRATRRRTSPRRYSPRARIMAMSTDESDSSIQPQTTAAKKKKSCDKDEEGSGYEPMDSGHSSRLSTSDSDGSDSSSSGDENIVEDELYAHCNGTTLLSQADVHHHDDSGMMEHSDRKVYSTTITSYRSRPQDTALAATTVVVSPPPGAWGAAARNTESREIDAIISKAVADYGSQERVRPPLSYARLAAMGIEMSRDQKCTVGEIYNFIESSFAFYRPTSSTSSSSSPSSKPSPLPSVFDISTTTLRSSASASAYLAPSVETGNRAADSSSTNANVACARSDKVAGKEQANGNATTASKVAGGNSSKFWRNCVRHNLSLKACFRCHSRPKGGNLWSIEPEYRWAVISGERSSGTTSRSGVSRRKQSTAAAAAAAAAAATVTSSGNVMRLNKNKSAAAAGRSAKFHKKNGRTTATSHQSQDARQEQQQRQRNGGRSSRRSQDEIDENRLMHTPEPAAGLIDGLHHTPSDVDANSSHGNQAKKKDRFHGKRPAALDLQSRRMLETVPEEDLVPISAAQKTVVDTTNVDFVPFIFPTQQLVSSSADNGAVRDVDPSDLVYLSSLADTGLCHEPHELLSVDRMPATSGLELNHDFWDNDSLLHFPPIVGELEDLGSDNLVNLDDISLYVHKEQTKKKKMEKGERRREGGSEHVNTPSLFSFIVPLKCTFVSRITQLLITCFTKNKNACICQHIHYN